MESHFLEKYRTHEKPEAAKAAKRKEQRTGETGIAFDKTKRIEAYIERLEKLFLDSHKDIRERNINLIKPKLYENVIIEDIPESHFEKQREMIKNRGGGDVRFTSEQKEQEKNRIQEAQKKSLDAWIDYLTGDDCKYPADVKYFAMQGVLRLGDFENKEVKYSFTSRDKNTTSPFAEIDREALSVVLGAVDSIHHHKNTDSYSKEFIDLIKNGKNFGDLYATAMFELDKKSGKKELLSETSGEWIVFKKGSDPHALTKSLEGKRSNLCIADIGSATTYLSQGDIEIYFSNDEKGSPTIPRIAIASAEGKGGVYEVRGTYNKNEDLDPCISETAILGDKLESLNGGKSFQEKDAHMKQLTELYYKCFKIDRKTNNKTFQNQELTKEELRFLYEIDKPIKGFGYEKDPRIAEIIEARGSLKKDIALAIGCSEDEISTTKEEALEMGNKSKYHYEDLDLSLFENAEGLTLPQSIRGDLDLDSLTNAKGLVLPQSVGGDLILGSLTNADGLVLPQSVGGDLDLYSLENADGLVLPQSVGGSIDLRSLTNAEGLVLPYSIGGGLSLDSLTTIEGLVLPKPENVETIFISKALFESNKEFFEGYRVSFA